MKDNHHGTIILHDFEDPFMRKESARDESFNFFKFISSTINTGARCSSKYAKFHLHSYLEKSSQWKQVNELWEHDVCVWLDDGGAPTNQSIWDKNYIEDSMTQHYMEFDEDHRDESRFWDHIFPQAEFDKSNNRWQEKHRNSSKREMMMVYLRRRRIWTENPYRATKSRMELEDDSFEERGTDVGSRTTTELSVVDSLLQLLTGHFSCRQAFFCCRWGFLESWSHYSPVGRPFFAVGRPFLCCRQGFLESWSHYSPVDRPATWQSI